jgi:acetyl-CoA C-acetyltransferase
MRGLPGDAEGRLMSAISADGSSPAARRVHHSFTIVNSIGYEDHGFAERFGGYQFVDAEVMSVPGATYVNLGGGLTVERGAPSATDVAQCPELFPHRHVEFVGRVPAGRIAVGDNIGGLTALSASTILEGPVANGS